MYGILNHAHSCKLGPDLSFYPIEGSTEMVNRIKFLKKIVLMMSNYYEHAQSEEQCWFKSVYSMTIVTQINVFLYHTGTGKSRAGSKRKKEKEIVKEIN